MAAKKPSLGVKDFNELISCHLCKGYLIDATTIIECLHSFCKTCIISHFESNTPKSRFCPRCDNQIHKTKPKLNIRSDPTLQDIVYKLVPGLYKNEMNRRKEFYSKESESAIGLSNEERGEMSGERLIFTPEDSIYLAIEYFPQFISYSLLPFSKNMIDGSFNVVQSTAVNGQRKDKNDSQRRYLKCEGGMRVLHLKKWLKLKYNIRDHNDIEILYKHDPLLDDYTMIDLAYIYSWRRNGPLCLYYKIIEPKKQIKEEGRPFKVPEPLKRRHTLKHRQKGEPNNKKIRLIDESNMITTNPVNEPLPPDPVDTNIINRVMTNNTIGKNLNIMTSVVNGALNMINNNNNKCKQKSKKCLKNGFKTNESIKQMKKKLDKSLNANHNKSVPKVTADKGSDLMAGAVNNNIIATINTVAANHSPPQMVNKTETNGHQLNGVFTAKPKQKSNSFNKPLNFKTTITPVPLPLLNNNTKSPTIGLFNKPMIDSKQTKPQNGSQTTNGLSSAEKVLKLMKKSIQKAIKSPIESPVPLSVPSYMSPIIPLPAPDIFQFMPFAQNSSKCLPNMSKTDQNSDNTINDIEVALNLSTTKEKTT